jgi:hypothetical protein
MHYKLVEHDALPNVPRELRESLLNKLKTAEKYLHLIAVKEYEEKLTKFDGGTLELRQLSHLAEFVEEDSKKYFNEPFGDPTECVLEQLGQYSAGQVTSNQR